MLASADPAPGRKFLRALCCPRHGARSALWLDVGRLRSASWTAPHAQARPALGPTDGLVAALGPGLLLVGRPRARPAPRWSRSLWWSGWIAPGPDPPARGHRLGGGPAPRGRADVALAARRGRARRRPCVPRRPLGDRRCGASPSPWWASPSWARWRSCTGPDGRELGLARPGRAEALVAVGGCLVLVAGGLVIGPAVARPFFGELDYPVPLAALVPAILFGVANGVLEEVLYRGALQAWLGAPGADRLGDRVPGPGLRHRARGAGGAHAAAGAHRPAHRRGHRGRPRPLEAGIAVDPDRDPRGRGHCPVHRARLPGGAMRSRGGRPIGMIAP